MSKRESVIINYNSDESITRAEAKKLKLENKGYRLIETTKISESQTILIYEK